MQQKIDKMFPKEGMALIFRGEQGDQLLFTDTEGMSEGASEGMANGGNEALSKSDGNLFYTDRVIRNGVTSMVAEGIHYATISYARQ